MKAVLFDLDGTILDSEHLHKEAEAMQCRQYNVELTQEDKDYFFGRPAISIFEYVLEKYRIPNKTVEQLIEENNEIYLKLSGEKAKLYEGFHELASFVSQNRKLALVTSCTSRIQEFMFSKFDLSKHFEVAVTIDKISKGKPDPEPYLKCLELLNIGPLDAIALEDSPNGILSAKRAGIVTLAIGHTTKREHLLHSPHYVKNLVEAKKWFEHEHSKGRF